MNLKDAICVFFCVLYIPYKKNMEGVYDKR